MDQLTAQQINLIYDHLEDALSKRIYMNRVLYNLTGDRHYLRYIFQEWNWEHRLVADILHYRSDICIYGAGDFGRRLISYFPELPWHAFVDNNANLIGKVNNLLVTNVEDFLDMQLPVIISLKDGYRTIAEELREKGVPSDSIICLQDYLCDMNQIYFDLERFEPRNKEVFVDAGVFDGKSTADFFDWCKGINSISYMFEPNSTMHDVIARKVEKYGDYKLVACGVWDNDQKLGIVKAENAAATYLSEDKTNSDEIIEVVSLDSFFSKEDIVPTYIKMDIEGAEMKALMGAENLIRNNKPRLAISIYHKPDDLWQIPSLILEYRSDYRFFIRHYTLSQADTVLYAI